MPKNIVPLSDGTGNSAAQLLKTNVWRVYEALELTDPTEQVACYYLDSGETSPDDAFDVGVRVAFSKDAYALSLEYVDRHLIDAGDAPRPWRLAGVFDYKVSSEVWLTGSFGRDYESKRAGSLLARLGVSLQLSKDRYQPTPP